MPTSGSSLPSTREPLVNQDGTISASWYRFFAQFHLDFSGSETVPGSGLTYDAGELGIAEKGVTNDKLRDSLGVSVIGRLDDSTGEPQDIRAPQDGSFLQRDNDQLVFRLPRLPSFTVATAPSASGQGSGTLIYVSDESGGATVAFSNGTNWLRVQDRAIIS